MQYEYNGFIVTQLDFFFKKKKEPKKTKKKKNTFGSQAAWIQNELKRGREEIFHGYVIICVD